MAYLGAEIPSGSGAVDHEETVCHVCGSTTDWTTPLSCKYADEMTNDEWVAQSNMALATMSANATRELGAGERYNRKIGPSFNGIMSFWIFQQDVQDWEDITDLKEEQRGPELKNRLQGEPATYKLELDRDLLKDTVPVGLYEEKVCKRQANCIFVSAYVFSILAQKRSTIPNMDDPIWKGI